ncbi:MAG: hypothetical protein KC983_12355, partial [Phycisphaerales bacterium]|nr:hypothetical protein [Phycisphaerales bacterium]
MRNHFRPFRPAGGVWAVGALLASVLGSMTVAVAQADSPALPEAPAPSVNTDQFDAKFPEAMK